MLLSGARLLNLSNGSLFYLAVQSLDLLVLWLWTNYVGSQGPGNPGSLSVLRLAGVAKASFDLELLFVSFGFSAPSSHVSPSGSERLYFRFANGNGVKPRFEKKLTMM